jgi:hypothetical protein
VNVLIALTLATTAPTIPIPAGYTPLVDDTHTIVVAVPEGWTGVDTASAVNDDGTPRPYIAASPDLDAFLAGFDAPGMLYAEFPYASDPKVLIDRYGLQSGCEDVSLHTYDDPVFEGLVQVGTNCGAEHLTWNMVVASPGDHSMTALVQVQSADDSEMRTVLLTFNVAGGPSRPSAPVESGPPTSG